MISSLNGWWNFQYCHVRAINISWKQADFSLNKPASGVTLNPTTRRNLIIRKCFIGHQWQKAPHYGGEIVIISHEIARLLHSTKKIQCYGNNSHHRLVLFLIHIYSSRRRACNIIISRHGKTLLRKNDWASIGRRRRRRIASSVFENEFQNAAHNLVIPSFLLNFKFVFVCASRDVFTDYKGTTRWEFLLLIATNFRRLRADIAEGDRSSVTFEDSRIFKAIISTWQCKLSMKACQVLDSTTYRIPHCLNDPN